MDFLISIFNTTIQSFDFSFCIVVTILTYIIIKCLNDIKYCGTIWTKRLILLCVIIVIAIIYKLIGIDNKLLINSAILAPVFWSWILKPFLKRLNLDYKI